MLRTLYDRTMRLAARPRAAYALGAVSFAESSFFPIPPDALLVPMIISDRRRAWLLAFICTVTSVLGPRSLSSCCRRRPLGAFANLIR